MDVRKVIYHTVGWETRQNFALEDFSRYYATYGMLRGKKHVTHQSGDSKIVRENLSQIFVNIVKARMTH